MLSAHLRPRLLANTALCSVLVASVVARAAADERTAKVDINRFKAAPDASAGFAVTDPTGLKLGEFAVSLTLDDAVKPLVLQRDDGTRADLVSNRFSGSIGALFGLYGPLSVGFDVPVVFQSGTLSALPPSAQPNANGALSGAALGDLRVTPRLALLQEANHGVDLAIDASLALPTGSIGALTTDGGMGGQANVTVGRTLGEIRVLGEAGVRFRPSHKVLRLDIGNELTLRAAAVYSLEKATQLPASVLAEIDAGTLLSDPFGSGFTSPAEWRVGGRYCILDSLAITVGAGGGLSKAYGTPLARVIAGVGYDPRVCKAPVVDQDGDGIQDGLDQCPTVKGDAEHHGCPKPEEKPQVEVAVKDTDNDGVPDGQDQCPSTPGVKEENGCPAKPPPDADEDGIFDKDDQCPNEAGTAEFKGCPPPPPDADHDGILDKEDECPADAGVPEFKGCPIPDKDKDGVLDKDDKCPTEAGPADRQGCPFHDQDGDGIEDSIDRCPADKGDIALFGCPVKDDDGDGVPNEVDNCPNEKGTKANNGCKAKQLVVIKAAKIEILEKVQFKTGKADIDKKSFKLLDQVTAVIKAHEEVGRIRVEGHTDNVGKPADNKKLSQDRAESVKKYLVDHGIPADRLDAVGYGEEQPIAPNVTAKGKEANRRVEFRILGAAVQTTVVAPAPAEPVVAPAPKTEPIVAPVKAEPVVAPAPKAEPIVAPVKAEEKKPEPVVAPVKAEEKKPEPLPEVKTVVPDPALTIPPMPEKKAEPVVAPKPEDKKEPAAAPVVAPKPEEKKPEPVVAPKPEEKKEPAVAPKPEEKKPEPVVAPKAEEKKTEPVVAPKAEEKKEPAVAPKAEEKKDPAVAPKPDEKKPGFDDLELPPLDELPPIE